MKRALLMFRDAGFKVTAAPVGFSGSSDEVSGTWFLPSADGMSICARASHELAGIAWYRLRTLFGK